MEPSLTVPPSLSPCSLQLALGVTSLSLLPPIAEHENKAVPDTLPGIRARYFCSQLAGLRPLLLQTVRTLIDGCHQRLNFDEEHLLLKQALDSPLSKNAIKTDNKVEAEIRRSKVRDMTRIKKELEQRLECVDQSLQLLRGETNARRCMERAEDALGLVKKMSKDRIGREKKKRERERTELERQQTEAAEAKKRMEEKEEEAKNRRKQEITHLYETLKKKREEDHARWEETKKMSKALKRPEEYLYRRYASQYEKQVVIPLLEQKKEELSKKRSQLRPLDYEELAAHKRKHDQIISDHEEERKKEIRQRQINESALVETQKKYRTRISSLVFSLDKEAKNEKCRKWMTRKRLREKMENYGGIVKDVSVIKPSKAKAEELKKLIDGLKHPVRCRRDTREEYSLTRLNFKSRELAHSKSALMCKKSRTNLPSCSGHNSFVATPILRQQRISNAEAQSVACSKKIDYLAQLREKRQVAHRSYGSLKYNWKADLGNRELSAAEKYDRIVSKANKMEGQAKLQEKLLQSTDVSTLNVFEGEKVAELFLDAIKAKLAILDQF